MSKIGIFFGSSTGTTEDIANRIAERLGNATVYDITTASVNDADECDVILLGTSTWGAGDLQDDWFDFKDDLKGHLSGKKIGFFGTGDSESYEETFCDAVGILYEELAGEATHIGSIPVDGYAYSSTRAEVDGKLVGLLIDEVNEPEKTDERIDAWVKSLGL